MSERGTLRRNIIANLVGKGWNAVLLLLLPPVYIKLLGSEAYGLIGLHTTMTAVLAVLDLGISTTLSRELARLSASSKRSTVTLDTVRTFEVIFWLLGLAAAGAIVLAAPLIATHWLKVKTLPLPQVIGALRLGGLVFALQWPSGLYNGGLLGLQRQVEANAILVGGGTLRMVGVVAFLLYVSRRPEAFFGWQAAAAAVQTLATRVVLYRAVRGVGTRGRFSGGILRAHWSLSTGLLLIGASSVVLTQADRVVVSHLCSLEDFGYYTLAWTIGAAIFVIIGPVFQAVFPRLTQLVERGDEPSVRELYHGAAQLTAVVLVPTAAVVVAFSSEVVFAWTGDRALASRTHMWVSLITVGSACNGLMAIPYALQLAHGWTRLVASTNWAAIMVLVPLDYVLARKFGPTGAAMGWVAINALYIVVLIHFVHKRVLRGDASSWYQRDVALPILGALPVTLLARLLIGGTTTRRGTALVIVGSLIASTLGALVATPSTRLVGLSAARRFWARAS